jgi:uncharacterized protein (TIGR03382 family)
MRTHFVLSAVAALTLAAGAAQAQVALWTFNSVPPDAATNTGTLLPAVGSGIASYLNTSPGNVTGFATGNPADTSSPGDNSRWTITNFPAQGTGSGTAGAQFAASTVGATDIIVSFYLRFSNTANRFMQFQYTTDGSTYTDFGGVYEHTLGGDTWVLLSYDLSTISGVNNNPSFGFRVVSVFGPNGQYVAARDISSYGTTGTWGFDLVEVVPTPGAMALLGLGGLVASRRRRA